MFGLAALFLVPVLIIRHWLRTGHYAADRVGQARGQLVFFSLWVAVAVAFGVWNLVQSFRAA